jgi:hypothetical protein
MMNKAIHLLLVLCIFLIGQDHKNEEAPEQPSHNEGDDATREREKFHPSFFKREKKRGAEIVI